MVEKLYTQSFFRKLFSDRPLSELLKAEREAVHANRGTSDSKEGMMAFLEKRKPVFNRSS